MNAITIDRNETSSRPKAKISTKPNTIGAFCFSSAFWSAEAAVPPLTAYSASGSLPIVAGRTSLRRVSSAAFDLASTPLPTSGIVTRATVCESLISTSIGLVIWPLASAFAFRAASARFPAGELDVALDRDEGRIDVAVRERTLDRQDRVDGGGALRQRVEATLCGIEAQGRKGDHDQQRRGTDGRDRADVAARE